MTEQSANNQTNHSGGKKENPGEYSGESVRRPVESNALNSISRNEGFQNPVSPMNNPDFLKQVEHKGKGVPR
jgi:hypothetical protein